MKKKDDKKESRVWRKFAFRTLFYLVILLGLIYLYQYSQVGGGSFIYNQF